MRRRKHGGQQRVRFSLSASAATAVFLVGDFNQWLISDMCACRRETDGSWTSELALVPGRYEYLFLVDGIWTLDPHAEQVPNPYGSHNSVVVVPADPGERRAA
ncbi:MAG: hypothetical protein HY335_03295 [Deinococcus sp.]|nr:hypothetical protein [Deinococcus sp.]